VHIYFRDKAPQKVLSDIKKSLSGRKIGELLDVELSGDDIHVRITKMGTSVLEFSYNDDDDGHRWDLSKEKLAFTHRAFKGEITEKLTRLITSLGGEVS